MYPRQFNSLQRQLSPPQHHYTSSSSRRLSESSRDSYSGGYVVQDNQDHYSHYGREAASRGGGGGSRIVPQRTYSNDAPHGQRMDGMGPIPNRESYLWNCNPIPKYDTIIISIKFLPAYCYLFAVLVIIIINFVNCIFVWNTKINRLLLYQQLLITMLCSLLSFDVIDLCNFA